MVFKPLNLISQFTCTSSLILLTHPEFITKAKGVFEIDTIYDRTKSQIWKFTDVQRIDTIPMQTFYIKLKINKGIDAILKFCKEYNNGASILNVTVVPKEKEIPDQPTSPPADFPEINKLLRGVQYTVPDELKDSVPKTVNIRKHVKYNGVELALYTRVDQTPVCEVDSK